MKRITLLTLIAAAGLLVAGCYGYGPHMGWGEHGGHMRGYRSDGQQGAPCTTDQRTAPNGYPCRANP